MPLLSIQSLSPNVIIGIWHLTESFNDFQSNVFLHEYYKEAEVKFQSQTRRCEYLATRALLRAMVSSSEIKICYEPSGKPYLSNGQTISISHTKEWVSVIIGKGKVVAVDVEYRSSRVSKIAHRFIRKDESAPDVLTQLLLWSLKETAYKYYSHENLEYFDMRVRPFELSEKGFVEIDNLKSGVTLGVAYRVEQDYVLTYALEH